MAIRVALNHRTSYQYDRMVELGPHVVRLRPAPHSRTPVLSYSMRVTPQDHFCNWQQDPQANYLARLVFPKPTKSLVVEVDLVAELTVINSFDFFLEPFAQQVPFAYPKDLAHEIGAFLLKEPASPAFSAFLASIDRTPTPTIDFLVALIQRLNREIRYVIRMEPGVQTCEETLTLRSGSCRDSAWLLVQLLRHLGLAARFVSGYLIQLAPDVKSLDGPSGTAVDFTDLHAWAEVYLPGAGWIGLDATSGLFAGEGHIPLACSPDPTSAAPISGLVDPCEVTFHHEMSVKRIHEDPRVTKPYTDEQWAGIDALGKKVDAALAKGDVRLTMGGEPTFVSIDDMEGAQWNTAALGDDKRRLAGALTRRMRARFAPGSLLHFGQGKWYPGETLPRWALGVYWRADGEPVWHDDSLIPVDGKNYGHTAKDAERFVRNLGARLGVNAAHAVAGYEDTWHYLWRERRLPIDVDPLASKLGTPEERARLARVFEAGLAEVVGYALPLCAITLDGATTWFSGPWQFRADRMFLAPGDSPMGLRLPLDSLPWERRTDEHTLTERDPHDDRPALPTTKGAKAAATAPQPETPVVRTALCVQARDGCLRVFMPPTALAEEYLELVAAIEATASELKLPVQVEGYTPPFDPRIRNFKVTPDPGVIEVNIHPADTWDELVANTTALYDEARLTRLGTEKFMLDGKHTGTGGGNHVVIGGSTPTDSPMLRRPDLLRSIIGYWHNHPCLTYVFSGMFVGPTSQAPRADEARVDAAYEMGIAFDQIPDKDAPLWLCDRAFRHLLVDVTGNTHRAEICIDKLYSPDSPTGRLGLVEFRGFEMPPHARMSLTQQLLIRALVARFWKTPYRAPLAHWGSDLYDRWALPHFLAQDFAEVLADLANSDFAFDAAWFASHIEFRFPRIGHFEQQGMSVELRQAVEPWYVLGEESIGTGTARYVDSSLERVQVLATGLTDARHIVTCNGKRVPLRPTGTNGQHVAGVRYRAWQPWSCLHPTIPVHTPLVFDLVDTWAGRSIGGCTYHVAHPGGRNYETFPVNAYEAESRRAGRFTATGHTPGPMRVNDAAPHPRFPTTLDLRASR